MVIDRSPRFPRHLGSDLLRRNRKEIPTVHSDIGAESIWIIGELAVTVPVEMPRTVVAFMPNTHRVVAKHYTVIHAGNPNADFRDITYALENAAEILIFLFVISTDKVDFAVQSFPVLLHRGHITEQRKIANVPHSVAGLNT